MRSAWCGSATRIPTGRRAGSGAYRTRVWEPTRDYSLQPEAAVSDPRVRRPGVPPALRPLRVLGATGCGRNGYSMDSHVGARSRLLVAGGGRGVGSSSQAARSATGTPSATRVGRNGLRAQWVLDGLACGSPLAITRCRRRPRCRILESGGPECHRHSVRYACWAQRARIPSADGPAISDQLEAERPTLLVRCPPPARAIRASGWASNIGSAGGQRTYSSREISSSSTLHPRKRMGRTNRQLEAERPTLRVRYPPPARSIRVSGWAGQIGSAGGRATYSSREMSSSS